MRRLKVLKWSMRKLTLPIYGPGLRLDVGSGGNPHPFADVLLEKYLDDTHRYSSIRVDRPMVLADAAKMPFRDKSFDFVFCYHVLEHMAAPEDFLVELERVGKAGYIETPNALYERVHPFSVHVLEIVHLDGVLHIRKKNGARGDDFLGSLDILDKDPDFRRFFRSNPRMFHVCYRWKGRIRYEILNPEEDTSWFSHAAAAPLDHKRASRVEHALRGSLRELLRRTRRGKVDLDRILVCPECRGDLDRHDAHYRCGNGGCGARFARTPLPDFNQPL